MIAKIDQSQRHVMQCMEVWGGNRGCDNAVSVPGIDAWVFSEPYSGDSSGGDIHYISMCAGGKIARFAVADISGHGSSASELAVSLRSLMRRYINTLNPARFVRALNRRMVDLAGAGKFATALLATYYAPTDQLILCNAGHPPALWYQAAAGQWRLLEESMDDQLAEASNLPLGIIQPTQYSQFAVQLQPGDLVLMYTDSLIETRNAGNRLLGTEGLRRLVHGLDPSHPESFSRDLLDKLSDYRSGVAADDDVTVILLHHHAAGRPRFGVTERLRTISRMLGLAKG